MAQLVGGANYEMRWNADGTLKGIELSNIWHDVDLIALKAEILAAIGDQLNPPTQAKLEAVFARYEDPELKAIEDIVDSTIKPKPLVSKRSLTEHVGKVLRKVTRGKK